jgi:outer membrane protein TolC
MAGLHEYIPVKLVTLVTIRRPDMRKLATLVLMTGLGGCATVPNLGPTPEPARSGAFAAARSLAGTPQEWPHDNWWQGFGDQQLDTLVGEALNGSPTIAQAAARIRVAMARADLARAARLPTAGVTAMARESRITQSIGLPTDGEWHLLVAGLANLSYDLDLWGKNRLALRAAVSAAQANESDEAAARLALAAAVARTRPRALAPLAPASTRTSISAASSAWRRSVSTISLIRDR